MEKLSVVILISGQGTNLQTMIDAAAANSHRLPIKILAVISNEPNAFGAKRARTAGIPTHIVSHKDFASREQFEAALQDKIDRYQPQLVVLAGFMRKLTPAFVAHYHGHMINIHPSLLPKHPGLNTHRRVLEAGENEHGATVHYVTEAVDAGPVICQARLPIKPDDTPERLKKRVQQLEYRMYPQVLLWIATGKLELKGDEVFFEGQPLPKTGLQLSF